jgi:hypothetical protein
MKLCWYFLVAVFICIVCDKLPNHMLHIFATKWSHRNASRSRHRCQYWNRASRQVVHCKSCTQNIPDAIASFCRLFRLRWQSRRARVRHCTRDISYNMKKKKTNNKKNCLIKIQRDIFLKIREDFVNYYIT